MEAEKNIFEGEFASDIPRDTVKFIDYLISAGLPPDNENVAKIVCQMIKALSLKLLREE